jgi:hypothetical protein
MATDAQIRANQQNARHSTGPKTAEGRAISAANAWQHGARGRGDVAIPRGPFREDPDELATRIDSIVASLLPRDAVEAEQARLVAAQYVKAGRVDAFEAHLLGSKQHLRAEELELRIEVADVHSWRAWSLRQALADPECRDDDWNWQLFIDFVIHVRNDGKPIYVKDLLMPDREPTTDAEWARAARTIFTEIFGDLDAARSWAAEYAVNNADKAEAWRAELTAVGAARIVNEGEHEKTIRMSGNISSQLSRALADYQKLQARDLQLDDGTDPSDAHNSGDAENHEG